MICFGQLLKISSAQHVNLDSIIQSGAIPILIQFLNSKNSKFVIPALRSIGNISIGNMDQVQSIIDNGFLTHSFSLLENNNNTILKEVCWILSNIAADQPTQVESIIKANLIPSVIKLLKSNDIMIRKEAAWVISNIAEKKLSSQVNYIVSQGCIGPLCNILLDNEVKNISISLQGLENILSVGDIEKKENPESNTNKYIQLINEFDGFKTIQNLQTHPNFSIQSQARNLTEKYVVD